MNSSFERYRWLIFAGLGAVGVWLLYVAANRPWLVANSRYLAALLALQLTLAALWHYEEIFFALLTASFLWSGMVLPLQRQIMLARWGILGVAAWMGLLLWLRGKRRHYFGFFHLIAAACVSIALVSTLVSEAPNASLEKVLSLCMLFLYAAAGARISLEGREEQLVRWLVLLCEILTAVTAPLLIVYHTNLFGHPNAVGAAMGVLVIPVLLCDLLSGRPYDRALYARRIAILVLAGAVLYESRARASILAAGFITILVCLVLRKHMFLLRAGFVVVFLLAAAGVYNPGQLTDFASSVTSEVIFKGRSTESGVWISRRGPWELTVASVKRHPWFGSGFGTSDIAHDISSVPNGSRSTGINREHGNSYLAVAEYMGLVGIIPFGILLLLLVVRLVRIYAWLRRTGLASHPYMTIVAILSAGLVHAFFEDWLFAVGSYLCLIFWSLAFVTMDFEPPSANMHEVNLRPLAWPAGWTLRPNVPATWIGSPER
ncbi:MAG TPA: O-antigen ligase family protein [Terriglobales bacterium]|nr:O-antigen ligase family protein [Terriglobales bacterium]